jgi:hypothetical protein
MAEIKETLIGYIRSLDKLHQGLVTDNDGQMSLHFTGKDWSEMHDLINMISITVSDLKD